MIAVGFDHVSRNPGPRDRVFHQGDEAPWRQGQRDRVLLYLPQGQPPQRLPQRAQHPAAHRVSAQGSARGVSAWRSVHCDPAAPWPGPPPCFDEFFDTRVYFDRTSRRFFILSVARATKEVNGKPVSTAQNPLVRRYWAFAVSKSEDPSAGFYQWMMTEAHWTDFPRVTVNDGVMVIEGDVEDYPQPLDVHPIG